jgi:hypothetical protein
MVIASSQTWAGYRYGTGFTTGGVTSHGGGGKCSVESSPVTTDGYDGSTADMPLSQAPAPDAPFYVAVYKTNDLQGWNGENGFYAADTRADLALGQTAIEDIYVWAAPGTPAEDIALWQGGTSGQPWIDYTLRLVGLPEGITYNGQTVWTGVGQAILPFYSTTNGLTGYHFQATYSAVPEPSSLLALAGTIAGFGGILLKRRR